MKGFDKLISLMNDDAFDRHHFYDNQQKSFCERDLNILFRIMGESDEIDEFMEPELTSLVRGGMIADRVGINHGENMIYSIEFESTQPSGEALHKQAQYVTALGAVEDKQIKAISITTSESQKRVEVIDYGLAGAIRVYVYPYYSIDGDNQLKIIKNKLKDNKPIDRCDIIFLSIGLKARFSMEKHEIFEEFIKIINGIYQRGVVDNELLENVIIRTVFECEKTFEFEEAKKLLGGFDMELVSRDYVREFAKKKYIEEAMDDVAKNMLVKGMDIDTIVELTGLSESRLDELKKTI